MGSTTRRASRLPGIALYPFTAQVRRHREPGPPNHSTGHDCPRGIVWFVVVQIEMICAFIILLLVFGERPVAQGLFVSLFPLRQP